MPLVDSQLQRPKPRQHSAPASLARIHWAARLGTAGAMLLMALAAVPWSASAQGMGGMGGMGGGGMGGGGMGGGGRGGGRGGRGGRSGGDESAQRGLSSGDVAKQIKELASLDRALDDVPDLDRQKTDSLKAIQGRYERIFESYAIAARNKVDSVRAAGGTPSVEDIRELRQEADSVRTGELVAARAVLTTDEQRGRFDRNVDDIRADEAKRQGGSGKRQGSGGMGHGGMGGAMQPPL